MIRLLRFLPTRWWSVKAWRTWVSYVHWRLETYGVYYPAGKWNANAFKNLQRQTPQYLRWLSEIDRIRHQPLKTRN